MNEQTLTESSKNSPVSESPSSPTPPKLKLTDEQVNISEQLISWFRDDKSTKESQSLSGFAGTGKTTVIKYIIDKLPELSIAVAAYTGKAVSVLKSKGLYNAQTLHSLLYKYDKEKKEFKPVESIFCDAVIVDEASMVNDEIYNDLMVHGVKVLFVGDNGQLEPIGDNPRLMANPDLSLTKIHRQAEQSTIIQFSKIIRDGKPFKHGKLPKDAESPELVICGYADAEEYMYSVDQVICGFNSTRHDINKRIRTKKGYTNPLEVGERVICLQNDREAGVYNGLVCTVTSICDESMTSFICNLVDEVGNIYERVVMSKEQFGKNKLNMFGRTAKTTYWDYGYCVTCHKSQGSEWDSVLVIEEVMPNWEYSRWAYTAVTRASKKLVYLCER